MHRSIRVRCAEPHDLDQIRAFYARWTDRRIDADARFVLADDGGTIVGAVRLCREHGYVVLRTMQIAEGYQRAGIGSRMLAALEPLIEGEPCYCLPYAHLPAFYGKIGFRVIDPAQAPPHLERRYREATAQGQRVLVMERPAGPRR